MAISGIYAIVNKVNGHRYVGSAVDITNRWQEHRRNKKSNPHLQSAIHKYGIDNFEFIILEECDESELLLREQIYLDNNEEYNISKSATSPMLGRHHTQESKLKFVESMKGKHWTWSEESRAKMVGNTNGKGTIISEEECARRSERMKGSTLWLGKHHSEESRLKIGAAHKGKIVSDETKRKLSVSSTGRGWSSESRLKLSGSMKGHNTSEETRKKISEAHRLWWSFKKARDAQVIGSTD